MQKRLFEVQYLGRTRKSPFIRLFDKTPRGIVCPHFYLLAWANGCPYRCAYCYLQGTFRGRTQPTVFTNRSSMMREVDSFLSMEKPFLLNTGELADSLAITDEVMISLVKRFSLQKRHKLLLVTKSANVDGLLGLEHNRQTIVSFSVNAPLVAEKYEVGAPPVERRLEAAEAVMEAGYPCRVRVDPMIPVDGWEEAYSELAERLNQLPFERVTLGTLRVYPIVKAYSKRLGRDQSVFTYLEERTIDGRLRPKHELRLRMYQNMLRRLTHPVGVCKETVKMHRELALPEPRCNCII